MTTSFSSSGQRRCLTARSPEDLLAVVPVVLGFHPTDSIVMLTFDAPGRPRRQGTTFHARVDLPPADHIHDAVTPLLEAALRHDVRRVAFVVYTDDAALGCGAASALREQFGALGCEVVALLRADGRRWFALRGRASDRYDVGTAYDLGCHPFSVQSVYDGTVTHASRAALADSLAPLPSRVAAVTQAISTATPPAGEARWAAEGVWAAERVRAVLDGSRLLDEDAARLLVGLTRVTVRDAVWRLIDRDSAAGHVEVWTELLRGCPQEYAAPPAALLAIAAYRSGRGALAWCAVDRCRAADPDYPLAQYVALALERALPPSAWDEIWDAGGVDPLVS